ncbi:hypothetical protein N9U06_01295 [Gammaproteobacteria bacterium]|nr:hypothetical protein [Gammaproteobacteria bacterium]
MKKVCSGSNMEGVDIDLIEFAGLPALTDEQHDKVWGESNEVSILENCLSAYFDWQDEDDVENEPLYTDRYFEVETDDVEKLKSELRAEILDLLNA